MALQKAIELENGIVTNYHRIVSLNKITNHANIIEIASYVNDGKRKEEETALKKGQETGEAVPMNVFIDTKYISKEYNENETIQDAYSYLKTLEQFKDAQDI